MIDSLLPTVLLVDDDATTRFLVRRHLTSLPLRGRIVEAADGQQALTVVAAHCQASAAPRSLLVLLDLNMPVMDGLAFLEHHATLPASYQRLLSVVVISATSSAAERERAHQLASAVLPKPLTREQVAALVHQYLPTALA